MAHLYKKGEIEIQLKMKTNKIYRNNGAIGALLDEYENTIVELKEVIVNIPTNELITILDNQTNDKDCMSIQTILSHVVESGFNYAIQIRKWLGESINYKNKELFNSIEEYNTALDRMFAFNEKLFQDHPNLQLETYKPDEKIKVRWGQIYDVEQLFEHAIVHILRHRRQIERFKIKVERMSA